jgi:hypothetical protein
MAQTVYLLCALTSLTCALLLARAYRTSRIRLLLWSVICFSALTLTNILLFIDMVIVADADLRPLRNSITLLGVAALLYGLTVDER